VKAFILYILYCVAILWLALKHVVCGMFRHKWVMTEPRKRKRSGIYAVCSRCGAQR
jgi:hypothetical protein